MARKISSSAAKKTSAAPTPAPVVEVTPVRNSAVPPKSVAIAAPAAMPAATPKAKPTHGAIELRAYYIWRSHGGGQLDNWLRAERELITI